MRVHTSLKGTSQNVNAIARLELELAYYNVSDNNVNHYATGTPLINNVTFNYVLVYIIVKTPRSTPAGIASTFINRLKVMG